MERVAIFWDIDSCPLPVKSGGYERINNIRSLAHSYGSATTFKAYFESASSTPANVRLQSMRHQFESSGLSLLECKGGDELNSVTHTLIADMLVFALDHSAPATIILISGKSELAYTISLLRHRRYRVIIVAASTPNDSLKAQASEILDWDGIVSPPSHEKPNISFRSFGSLLGNNKPSLDTQDLGIIINGTNKPGVIPRSIRAKSVGSASKAPPLDPNSRVQPQTTSWRNLNPSLNIDPNSNSTTNAVTFKPLHLRRLTSGMGETTNSSTKEDNGDAANELQYLDTTGSGLPVSSNLMSTYQLSQRGIHGSPFASFNNDFVPGLWKKQSPEHSLSPSQTARSLSGVEETEAHTVVCPPSERTKIGTPPTSPNWTTVSHGPFHKQCTTGFSEDFTPPVLPSPRVFTSLVEQLEKLRLAGNPKPLRSLVGCELNKRIYTQAGVQGFSSYVALAEKMGIVELGGIGGKAWIGLQSNWRDAFSEGS